MSVIELRRDDISGDTGDDVAEVAFTWAGQARVIDLAPETLAAFETAIRPFLDASRNAPVAAPAKRASKPRKANADGSPAPRPAGDPEAEAIRVYARANGIKVSERGRISNAAREAWVAAGSPATA